MCHCCAVNRGHAGFNPSTGAGREYERSSKLEAPAGEGFSLYATGNFVYRRFTEKPAGLRAGNERNRTRARVRILEITHYMPPHPGGIERVAASLVEGLSRRGHDVRWIASATPRTAEVVQRLVRVSALNVLETQLGVPYPIWSPGAMAQLAREVRRADVVHIHDCLYMGSAGAAALCRTLGRPLVITQHVGYVPFGPLLDAVQLAAYHTIGRSVLGSARGWIACSAHVPAYFESLGIRHPFEMIHNGMDDSRFRPPTPEERRASRAEWGVAENARVILFVGRLVPKKAVGKVIELQRALAVEGTTLVVVGDGPQADELIGTPGLVHHPEVAAERMPELFRLADVFTLPSSGEGMPLSAQEALMSGLPAVVSTDPSYMGNLAGAPGVAFAEDHADLVKMTRRALAGGLASQAEIAGWARARWGLEQFVSAYESIMQDLVTKRTA